jgi:hypothetical protein
MLDHILSGAVMGLVFSMAVEGARGIPTFMYVLGGMLRSRMRSRSRWRCIICASTSWAKRRPR